LNTNELYQLLYPIAFKTLSHSLL